MPTLRTVSATAAVAVLAAEEHGPALFTAWRLPDTSGVTAPTPTG